MRFGLVCVYRRLYTPVAFVLYSAFFFLLGSASVRAQTPVVNAYSPTTVCQSNKVTITGSNFTGATSVQLGTVNAAGFIVQDDHTIIAMVADYSTNGPVSVGNANGTGTGPGTLAITPAPKPALMDIGTLDAQFTNCDGNATYTLKVRNNTTGISGTGYTYEINWGDATTLFSQADWPAGATLNHTYNSHGYYNVVITITAPNGCTVSKTYQFYNGKNPLASFTTTNPTTGLCVPAPVEFQIGNWFNNTAGTFYTVDFGDGTTPVRLNHPLNAASTVQLISHTYNTSSCPNIDYTAKLNAINGCFTTTYTLNQIVVRKKPTADFNTNIPPPCVNTQVCLQNTTLNGNSGNSCNPNSNFTWDFGDGTPVSNQISPCHTYTASGTFTITLNASNAACGSDVKQKSITILSPSVAPVVNTPVTYCQGKPASPLTATGTGLLWYTGATGGIGSSIAPTPSTSSPGTFTWYVSQTTPGNCEGPRVPISVVVNPLPAAPQVSSPVQLCQGQTANPLTANGTDLLWYTVQTGGSGSTTPPTPITTTVSSTTYYVSQTLNGCEGPRAAITVNVNALATAPGVVSPKDYCQNDPASPLTAAGTGLVWYDVATGGTALPGAPTPNTTIVGSTTWYVSQVTGCGEGPRAAITVNVNARPSASISYNPSTLCNVLNSAARPNPPVAVMLTGTTGGTFSVVPAGLPIDAASGEINPSGATPGNYTVRYTIKGSGGCPDYVTTATVIINGTPTAVISYPALCSSDAPTRPQITGSLGGSFSSVTPGLTIDAATGAISPASSTPGTYTVNYVIAPSGPCPGFNTSASVTITQAPFATIAYTPANVCNVSSPPVAVTQTGSAGGSYSITPSTGLSIHPSTGEITPAGATPGTYTIKYTVPGTGGCANYTVTTTVTVSGAPVATIQYNNAPYCTGSNVPQKVTRTGTAGGAYTTDAGLSIDAATGDINPSLSTPGVHTITYTIAPSAPCPGYTANTQVTIIESPVISFNTTSQAICSGSTAVFTPTSSVPNTTYKWAVVGVLLPNVNGISSGTTSGDISLSFTNTGTTGSTLTIQVIPANPVQSVCTGTPINLTLEVNPVPPSPKVDTFHLCMGAPATALQVNPIASTTIKWYDASSMLLNTAPVINTANPAQYIYYVTQAYANGCESPKTKAVAIVHPTAKIVSSSYTNPTSCGIPSGTIVLNVLDLNNNAMPNLPVVVHYDKFQTNFAYPNKTDGAGKITIPLVAGTYENIYVETGIGCMSQKIPDVFVLKDPNPPVQPVAGYNPPICSENPLQLTALSPTSSAAGPIDYVWAGPAFGPLGDTVRSTTVTFSAAPVSYAGTYIVYAIQNNCISTPATFQVAIRQSPTKPIITTRNPLCIGDDLVLQAASAMPGNSSVITYTWKGPGRGFPVSAAVSRINKVILEDAGIYTITAYSPETGCSSSTDTLIQIGGYPIVHFSQDTVTVPTGFRLKLEPMITNAASPGILPMKTFAWTPSQDIVCNDAACSSPVATIKNNICYAVKATNIYGCSGSDTICVKTFCTGSQVFIPNAFAPRGDVPENQKLMVRASGIASVKSFRVFNRWGKILFEKNNFPPNSPDYGWDGRINGRLADPGVYIYTVDVICENGVPYTYKGNVTLF